MSDDEAFRDLEKEDDPAWLEYRHKRMTAQPPKELYNGSVCTAQGDAEILHWTTHCSRAIVHFFHPDYSTCSILDAHLKDLAAKHVFIKWLRVSVLETPFLVQKLKIRMLPCLDIFHCGKHTDRILGFDELGGIDSFETKVLETRLFRSSLFKIQ